jgi:DNA-directed RNA polymerase subunit K/omega
MEDRNFAILMHNLDKVTKNPYEAVLVASRRARAINTGRLQQMEMMTEDSEEAIDYRKVTTQAIEDMLRQRIKYHYRPLL